MRVRVFADFVPYLWQFSCLTDKDITILPEPSSALESLLGGDKALANKQLKNWQHWLLSGKHLLFYLDVMNKKPDRKPN